MRTITKAALTEEVTKGRFKESALITKHNREMGLSISLDMYNDLRVLSEEWRSDSRGSTSITLSNLSGYLGVVNGDDYPYKALRVEYKDRPCFVLISTKWADLIKD